MSAKPKKYWQHMPFYPEGKCFGEMLDWHITYWGTLPGCSLTEKGIPWKIGEFVRSIHIGVERQDALKNTARKLENWRFDKHPVGDEVHLDKILEVLFGCHKSTSAWRKDLCEAHERRLLHNSSKLAINQVWRDTNTLVAMSSVSTVSANIPRRGSHFIGRENDLASVLALFPAEPESAAILIQGGPGIGKTELTKEVAHHPDIVKRFGEHRWFVPLDTATDAAKMESAIVLAIGCDPKLGFEAILNNLRGKQALLVLDNLETPWEPPDQQDAIEALLSSLNDIAGLSLLASFRGIGSGGDIWGRKPIKGLSPQDAARLFAAIASPWILNDLLLPKLIRELGGIPLAIDLVARRAQALDGDLLPLWREWQHTGTDFIKRRGRKDDRLNSLSRSITLSLDSPRVKDQTAPSALRLFSLLGLLPAGLCAEDRDSIMGEPAYDAAECLLSTGLAVERSGRIDLLPPIREFARRRLPPETCDTRHLVRHFFNLVKDVSEEETFYAPSAKIIANIINIESALKVARSVGLITELLESLDGFVRIIKYHRNIYYERGLKILEELSSEFLQYDAAMAAAKCLLAIYDALGWGRSSERAHVYLNRARELYDLTGNSSGKADCLIREASNLEFAYKYDEAIVIYSHALGLYRADQNQDGMALCYYKSGIACLKLARYHDADVDVNIALQIYKNFDREHDIGRCLLVLGDIRYETSQYNEAFDLYDEAFVIFKKYNDRSGIEDCMINIYHHFQYLSRKGIGDQSRGPARDSARAWVPAFMPGDR